MVELDDCTGVFGNATRWYFIGGHSPPKKETKKEREARLSEQRMHDSWGVFNQKQPKNKNYMNPNFNKPRQEYHSRKY